MAIERTNSYILNYLDEPTKILFLTPAEVVTIVVCFISGVLFLGLVTGLASACLSIYAMRKLRAQFKTISARQWAYWYLTSFSGKLKLKIPSHVREIYS